MVTQKERQDTQQKVIKEFYDKFNAELHRNPTKQELIDNLVRDPSVHDLLITEEAIEAFLD
jgi:hypothetical protein